ncbi:zinc finger and BTB domain-containing protein 47-like isoform X2 [Saccostrea cucullata]|uniref:zinc finger and BTB domain-containing protein 47-like isoform X2 n=1 Tax=Saccostrea cuccullata TaxID=36930 RepID=UPI002ED4D154
MEHILRPGREYFAVSVDAVAGTTYVSGTEFGRKFLLEKLSQIAGTNVFAAFLRFCRERPQEKKTLYNAMKAAALKLKKAQKVFYPLERSSEIETEEKKLVKIIPGNSKEILVISSKPNRESTKGLKPYSQVNKPAKTRKTIHPCKHGPLPKQRSYFESLPKSKDEQARKRETKNELVRTFFRGDQEKEKVTFLHAETRREISLEDSGVEFNENNLESHQDEDIQNEENSDMETTEENIDVSNPLVNTFSLQNESPSFIHPVLPCNENSQPTEEVFQVKQEPEWDLENLGDNGLGQELETQTSSGEKEHQMETETNTEECNIQDQGIGEASSTIEESLHSTEFNDDLVIKQEPDWEEPEEENGTMNQRNAEVGTNTSQENDDDESNETPDDSEEESAEEDMDDETEKDQNSTDKDEDTGFYTCNVGDHMYCVPLPNNKDPEQGKGENRRISSALMKLQQAREEKESKEQEEEKLRQEEEEKSRQEEGGAQEETEQAPVKKVYLYRCMIRNPKTGKFCSVSNLKRYEALRQGAQKAKEKRVKETKVKAESNDPYTGRFVFEDPESKTGYIVRKLEWKCHCGQKFMSQHEFAEHDKEYHNTRLRLCAYCGEFLELRKYKSHVKKHEPNTRNYQCSLCGNMYSTAVSLKRHLEFLHGGKKVPCNDCGKSFKSMSSYRRHLLTHKNILNHLCNYCGKKFISKYAMETHARVHTGERPFACEYCGLRFNHNVSRKTHIKKAHAQSVLQDDVAVEDS